MPKYSYNKLTFLLLGIYILIVLISLPRSFYEFDKHFLYSEFIQSNNFGQLVKDDSQTFNPRINGGTYNLGLPMSPQNNNIYGTNRGTRVLPLLVFLDIVQKLFGSYWDKVYFIIALFLPLVIFLSSAFLFHSKKVYTNYVVAGFFYAFNPWIINRLNTGFLQLHLAYAFMPIPLFILFRLHRHDSLLRIWIYSCLMTVALTMMLLFQPHFLIMLGLLTFIFSIIFPDRLIINKRPLFVLFLLTCISFIGINIYHIVPSVIYPPFLYTRITTFSIGSVLFNGAVSTLADVINLIPRPLFDTSPLLIFKNARYLPHMLFYLFVVSILLNKERQHRLLTWFIASLSLFIFLSKGLNEPLVSLSKLVYEYVPFMHAFRDPSRLIAAVVLVCAISFGVLRDSGKYRAFFLVYLIYAMTTSLIQFRSLPINNWLHKIPYGKYSESEALTDNRRLAHLPNDTAIFGSQWYNKSANSALVSPLEAINPSKSNLATYSGSHDSLFQHSMLYALTLFGAGSEQTSNLLDRLHIGKIVIFEKPEMYIEKLQLLKAYKEGSERNSLSIPTSSLLNNNPPVFILGEAYDYASIGAKIKSATPIINLSQYVNAVNVEFLDTNEKVVLLTDKKQSPTELTLGNLNRHSMKLDYEARNYDTPWSSFMPYAKKTIEEGYLLRSGKAIATTNKDAVLSIHPNKAGPFILALNILTSPEYGDVNVYLNRSLIQAIDDQEVKLKGFNWRLYKIDLSINSQIDIHSLDAVLTVLDDALLIPFEEYTQKLRAFQKLVDEKFIIQPLSSDVSVNSDKNANLVYTSTSPSEYVIQDTRGHTGWLTTKIPYDTHWSSDVDTIKFISNGYAVSFFTPGSQPISRIYYKPELLFRICLGLSTGILLLGTMLALYAFYRLKTEKFA